MGKETLGGEGNLSILIYERFSNDLTLVYIDRSSFLEFHFRVRLELLTFSIQCGFDINLLCSVWSRFVYYIGKFRSLG